MSSRWWPVPAQPSSWFDEAELSRSLSYHGPLRKVVGLRTSVQAGGFFLAIFVSQSLVSDASTSLSKASLAVGLCWLAAWLPAVASDWWLDQRHEPRFGATALPRRQLVVGSAVVGLALLVGMAISGSLLAWLISATSWWPVWFVAGGGTCIAVGSGMQHLAEVQAMGLVAAPPEENLKLQTAAAELHVAGVSFWSLSSGVEPGCNALTLAGPSPGMYRIAVSEELLVAPEPIRRFVVAHELGHIRFGHLRQQAIIAVVEVLTTLAIPAVVISLRPSWVGLSNSMVHDARILPVFFSLTALTSMATGLVSSWFSRSTERQADAYAAKDASKAGIDLVSLVHDLYLSDRSNLRPSLMERLLARHPSAAERLQLAKLTASNHVAN